MRLGLLVIGSILLAPIAANAANRPAPIDVPRNASVVPIWRGAAEEAPATFITIGDEAPTFSYMGSDNHWHKFSDLAAKQPVLLVFGATESQLSAIEAARGSFLELGIVPVAVVDRRIGSVAAMKRRLKLKSHVIGDPMRAIAELYNSLDANGLQHAPAYFVLDENHLIRALGRGRLPAVRELLRESAQGLGRPVPDPVSVTSG
jgi:peroxiredoxin